MDDRQAPSILVSIHERLNRKKFMFPPPRYDTIRWYLDFYDAHVVFENNSLKLIRLPGKGFAYECPNKLDDLDTVVDWVMTALSCASANFRQTELVMIKRKKLEEQTRGSQMVFSSEIASPRNSRKHRSSTVTERV